MKKNQNFISGFLIVILCLLTFAGCSNLVKKNHTGETNAKITSVGSGCGSSYRVVNYVYTVNGKNLENWTCYSDRQAKTAGFVPEMPATACYDPSNPKDSTVIPTGFGGCKYQRDQ